MSRARHAFRHGSSIFQLTFSRPDFRHKLPVQRVVNDREGLVKVVDASTNGINAGESL